MRDVFTDVVNGKRAKRSEVLQAFDLGDLDAVRQWLCSAFAVGDCRWSGTESDPEQGRVSAERGRARAGAGVDVPRCKQPADADCKIVTLCACLHHRGAEVCRRQHRPPPYLRCCRACPARGAFRCASSQDRQATGAGGNQSFRAVLPHRPRKNARARRAVRISKMPPSAVPTPLSLPSHSPPPFTFCSVWRSLTASKATKRAATTRASSKAYANPKISAAWTPRCSMHITLPSCRLPL